MTKITENALRDLALRLKTRLKEDATTGRYDNQKVGPRPRVGGLIQRGPGTAGTATQADVDQWDKNFGGTHNPDGNPKSAGSTQPAAPNFGTQWTDAGGAENPNTGAAYGNPNMGRKGKGKITPGEPTSGTQPTGPNAGPAIVPSPSPGQADQDLANSNVQSAEKKWPTTPDEIKKFQSQNKDPRTGGKLVIDGIIGSHTYQELINQGYKPPKGFTVTPYNTPQQKLPGGPTAAPTTTPSATQPVATTPAPVATTPAAPAGPTNPWTGKDPAKADAWEKLSPQMKANIGGADPTDKFIISAMADGSGWGRAKGITDANPDGTPKVAATPAPAPAATPAPAPAATPAPAAGTPFTAPAPAMPPAPAPAATQSQAMGTTPTQTPAAADTGPTKKRVVPQTMEDVSYKDDQILARIVELSRR